MSKKAKTFEDIKTFATNIFITALFTLQYL